MTPPKEHNKFMVTDTREMEIGKIFHKEFKAIVLKKLSYKTKNKQKPTPNSMKSGKQYMNKSNPNKKWAKGPE